MQQHFTSFGAFHFHMMETIFKYMIYKKELCIAMPHFYCQPFPSLLM